MTATRSSQPFQELRELLSEMRQLLDRTECARGYEGESSQLFDRLDNWVASAEQRKRRSDSVIDSALDAVVA